MQNNDTKNACPCCECDPCDCHGMECDELWRVDKNRDDQKREDTELAGQRDRSQSESGQQMETRQHSKDSILSEGDCSGVQTVRETIRSSSKEWCIVYWDCY